MDHDSCRFFNARPESRPRPATFPQAMRNPVAKVGPPYPLSPDRRRKKGKQRKTTKGGMSTAIVSRCGTMTGSRRHAGTALGGRRGGRRPRSATGQDNGRRRGKRPRSLEGKRTTGTKTTATRHGHGYGAQRTAVRKTETKFSGRRQVQYLLRGTSQR